MANPISRSIRRFQDRVTHNSISRGSLLPSSQLRDPTSFNSCDSIGEASRSVHVHQDLRSSDDSCWTQRPCYWMLRLTGIWQPQNCWLIWDAYSIIVVVLFVYVIGAILFLNVVHNGLSKFVLTEFVNSVFTAMNLGCPFLFTKYYFHCNYGKDFKRLVDSVATPPGAEAKLKKINVVCSILSFALWVLWGVFFAYHWTPLLREYWQYEVYCVTIGYSIGWWACWLSVYWYACFTHILQAKQFVKFISEKYPQPNSDGTQIRIEEKAAAADVLCKFNQLKDSLHDSQKSLGNMISFCIIYHAMDVVAFSVSYWAGDFGSNYTLWQFIGGTAFDLLSIFVKLYPAAIVNSVLQDAIIEAGKHCVTVRDPDHDNCFVAPHERFKLFRHFCTTEPYVGLHILASKVSMKITGGLFFTVVTIAASVIRYVVPHEQSMFIPIEKCVNNSMVPIGP